jgi:hypothetical protein
MASMCLVEKKFQLGSRVIYFHFKEVRYPRYPAPGSEPTDHAMN